MSDAYTDLRRIAFEALVTDAVLATEMLAGLTSRDDPASIAALVKKAHERYREILERRAALTLSREETSLLQQKLDRLQAQLRFFGANPRGYTV